MPNFLARHPDGSYAWQPRLSNAVRVLVASDFDGTLSEIAPTPQSALPLPEALTALAELAANPRFRVALVSGRPLADLQARCPVPGAVYLGSHGNEFSGGSWLPASRRAEFAALFHRLAERCAPRLAAWPGVRLEVKPFSLTLHYRQAPNSAAQVRAFAADLAAAEGLRLQPARQAVELLPPGVLDKGAALLLLRARLGCDLAFYFGDDHSDADVFALQDPGLIGIQVEHREGATPLALAEFEIDGPAGVALALQELARAGATNSNNNPPESPVRS